MSTPIHLENRILNRPVGGLGMPGKKSAERLLVHNPLNQLTHVNSTALCFIPYSVAM